MGGGQPCFYLNDRLLSGIPHLEKIQSSGLFCNGKQIIMQNAVYYTEKICPSNSMTSERDMALVSTSLIVVP